VIYLLADHDQPMRTLHSPHYDARPDRQDIDLIVLHAISLPAGEFNTQHVEALFMGNLDCTLHPCFQSLLDVKVSAHFVVNRDGQITQYVDPECRAWHAGISTWQGRDHCNDYAIGIEMIGDEQQPFTADQYCATARLCHTLMQRYPAISQDRIIGHADIAPGRKWDPGKQWDWQRFQQSLRVTI